MQYKQIYSKILNFKKTNLKAQRGGNKMFNEKANTVISDQSYIFYNLKIYI